MKEKILDFFKNLPKKYGWKFWVAIAFGFLFSFAGFSEGFGYGVLLFIPHFLLGAVVPFIIMCCLKFYALIFKGAGKGVVAVGKGAAKGVVAVGAAAVGGAALGANTSSTSSSSSESGTNSKERKKRYVHQMRYIGRGLKKHQGLLVTVYSDTYGTPAPDELLAAIKDMGFDDAMAHGLWNGMSNLDWELVSTGNNH